MAARLAAFQAARALALVLALGVGACLPGCASDDSVQAVVPERALLDPNGAVRTKAVHEAVRQGGRAHLPRLIEMLDDPDPCVRLAAGRGLQVLTGHDTGYRADLSASQRREQVLEWRAWYSSSGAGSSPAPSSR